MANGFLDATIVSPRTAKDDDTWEREIAEAERAVDALLKAKQAALRESPVLEHVLWSRYQGRLHMLKRNLDAAVW